MLVTIRGMSMTALCDGLSSLPEGIQVFGGGAFSGDIEQNDACVFSSVGGYQERSIVFAMFGGEDLHLETGYMTGMGNGIFAPEEPVTREQMYTILAAVGRSRKLAGGETVPLMTMDRAEIADWALDGVDFCYTGGLVPEKYLYVLSPKAFVRRGEIADVLYRFCMWEEGNL